MDNFRVSDDDDISKQSVRMDDDDLSNGSVGMEKEKDIHGSMLLGPCKSMILYSL